MARAVNRLKDITIRKATKAGMYADGAGLYLRVGPSGSKAWIFRYRQDGKLHDLGLGPLHTISLATARQRAQKYREQRLVDGADPLAVKRAARHASRLEAAKAMTFEDCAKAYIAAHQAGWRNEKHRNQWSATLTTYAYPVFGRLPVQVVDTMLVMKAIEPVWNTKPETASRLRGRIESVLDWATTRGFRQGENPARWRGHLENLLPKKSKVKPVEHHAALPYADMVAFMAELRERDGVAAHALEFAILTSARTSEVIEARWDELNLLERLWIVPGSRMKAGKEHRVPLADAAMTIIEKMAAIRQSDFVFPGAKAARPMSNMALLTTLRRMGRGALTAHGFRSTFRDWASEQTSFPAEVAEMALAHVVSNKVEAAYRRGDLFEKRRDLAAAWAQFCDGSTESEVVPLRVVRSAS